MFGYIVAGVTALAFGGIAIREATKTTGEKVKDGDSVFVRADGLHLVDSSPTDDAGLKAFLAGFLQTSVKVTNVHLPVKGGKSTDFTGTIIGFPRVVAFASAAVNSIERNGARIT